MPRNEHEKEVVYESVEGTKRIYAVSVSWEDRHLSVRHCPRNNQREFLHEDEMGLHAIETKEIPLSKVFEVNSI